MFEQYEPNVKTTFAFLKHLNVKVNKSTVNDVLQSHPDWPSLLCISDSLNKWNVPNAAGRISTEEIDTLPTPFMAHMRSKDAPLSIVEKVSNTHVTYYSNRFRNPTVVEKKVFFGMWKGVYLIAEPNRDSGEIDYRRNKIRGLVNSNLLLLLLIGGALIFLIYTFYRSVSNAGSLSNFLIAGYFQFFIHLCGLAVTSLLIWHEVDRNNPILHRVCTGIAKTNCNAVLTSKGAKIFKWLSWSEVGFFYFSSCLLILTFSGKGFIDSLRFLSWLNIFAISYTFYSVYYQWRVAKQWCILCLAVQALLILAAINTVAQNLLGPFYVNLSLALSMLAIPTAIIFFWFGIKPYALQLQQAKGMKREYLRLKFNSEIFDTLLIKQKQIHLPVDDLGIEIGNKNAKNKLIKVCNPYCNPCAKAHEKLENLLKNTSELSVKIIFIAPNNENNLMFPPVRHFMSIAEEGNVEMTKSALDDWYLMEEKDYDRFADKYPLKDQFSNQGSKIESMNKWCRAIGIDYTPTIFLNGYQLPGAYNIEDLQYFLLE